MSGGGEARARWEAPGRNALTVGGEYTYHPNAHQENFTIPGNFQFLDDKRKFATWGIYLQDEFSVTRTLTTSPILSAAPLGGLTNTMPSTSGAWR